MCIYNSKWSGKLKQVAISLLSWCFAFLSPAHCVTKRAIRKSRKHTIWTLMLAFLLGPGQPKEPWRVWLTWFTGLFFFGLMGGTPPTSGFGFFDPAWVLKEEMSRKWRRKLVVNMMHSVRVIWSGLHAQLYGIMVLPSMCASGPLLDSTRLD
jgi:hypothetical protein